MRNAFADEMTKMAAEDNRVILLSGDIGNRLFDGFKASFAERFVNCGVAEANMTSMAAGLALGGFRPVTYTIASFNTYRCYEQIRVDLGYHKLPVIVVGVGAGLSYAELGGTHHSCEDIAVLRAVPNMTILAPGDSVELRACLKLAIQADGPVYIRIGKKGEPVVHDLRAKLDLSEPIELQKGQKICVLSTGTILPEVVAAIELIKEKGVICQAYSIPMIKPLNKEFLSTLMGRFDSIATVEEHSLVGGFGSSVAEFILDLDLPKCPRLLRIATPDAFIYETTNQEHAREITGLSAGKIAARILQHLRIG